MMKRLFTLGAALLMVLQVQAQVPSALEAKLQDTLQDMAVRYNFKGLSAAVSYKDKGIWKSAVGISTGGTPLTPGMLIGIGSNTKTYVSTLLLQLQEQGLLSMDDTIGTWVSGYANIKGSITIRQVLNHTSGIASYTNNIAFWTVVNADLTKLWTKDEILAGYVTTESFAPGTSWEYSNTNYLIAGMIAEKLTGRSIQDLLRDSIIKPLGLKHTFFPPYETVTDTFAHFWSDIDGDRVLDDACNWNAPGSVVPSEINSAADAAGALVSTPEDNVMFWKALMEGRLISKSTIANDLLKMTGFGSSASDYGLGIMKMRALGKTVFGHGGTWIGQLNENLSDTFNGIYITVLSNQDSLDNGFVNRVVNALYKVVMDYNTLGIASTGVSAPELILYPNPASSSVNIRMPSVGGMQTFEMYDLLGKKLLSHNMERSVNTYTADLSTIPEGMYLIRISSGEEVYTTRLQVKH